MSSKGDKDVLVAVQVRLGTLDETATPWTQWLEAMELLLGEQHPLIPNALARDGLGLELRVFVPRGIPETGESAAARDVRIAENVRDEKRIYDKNEDKLRSAHQFFSTMLRACTERMVEAVRTDSLFRELNSTKDIIGLLELLEQLSSTPKGASIDEAVETAQTAFLNARMQRSEDLSNWKKRIVNLDSRFKTSRKRQETARNIARPVEQRVDIQLITGWTDREKAERFIKHLDPSRWGDLIIQLSNMRLLQPLIAVYPATLSVAFTMADTFKVRVPLENNVANSNGGARITLASAMIPVAKKLSVKGSVVNATSVAVKDTPVGKKNNGKNRRGRGGGGAAVVAAAAAAATTTENGAAAQQQQAAAAAQVVAAGTWRPPVKVGVSLTNPAPKTCFKCGKVGHIAANCNQNKTCTFCGKTGHTQDVCYAKNRTAAAAAPTLAVIELDDDEDIAWPSCMLQLATREAKVKKPAGMTEWSIMADSGSVLSVFCNRAMLEDIETLQKPISIVGSTSAEPRKIFSRGRVRVHCGDFGWVYYDPEGAFNIIALHELQQLSGFNVTKEGIQVGVDDERKLFAKNRAGLYIFDANPKFALRNALVALATSAAAETIEGNLRDATTIERKQMTAARNLELNLGAPSAELKRMLFSGNITSTGVLPAHVDMAQQAFGKNVVVLKGATVSKSMPRTSEIKIQLETKMNTVVTLDIMHVLGTNMLIGVTNETGMILTQFLPANYTAKDCKVAIERMQAEGRSVGHELAFVSDGEPALSKAGVKARHETLGAGDHAQIAERMIRVIKERMRGMITSGAIPFTLDSTLIAACIKWCCDTISMVPSERSGRFLSPREQWLRRKTDSKLDLPLRFGDYCQTHEEVMDPMKSRVDIPRSLGCIALYSARNARGSYRFLNLTTWEVITRQRWTKLPWPQPLLDLVNARGVKMRKYSDVQLQQFLSAQHLNAQDDQLLTDNLSTIEPIPEEARGNQNNQQFEQLEFDIPSNGGVEKLDDTTLYDQIAPIENEWDNISDITAPIEGWAEAVEKAAISAAETPRYGTRSHSRATAHQVLANLTVKQARTAHGDAAADAAIAAEIAQLHLKPTWKCVHASEIDPNSAPHSGKPIGSGLFLKAKFRPDGEFDKIKARLVSRGNHQDASAYAHEERTAPTVSLTATLATVAVAAGERAKVENFDITSAFTFATMKKKVYMLLDKTVSAIYVQLFPEVKQYVDAKGQINVQLLRALYGCLESAQLWYELLSKLMISAGFKNSVLEPCVWKKGDENSWIVVLIYVDDGLVVASDNGKMAEFKKQMSEWFRENVKFTPGPIINYVGMVLDFTVPGVCRVSMPHAIKGLMEDYSFECRAHKTPAGEGLFNVDEASPPLRGDQFDVFYSIVYRLLYIAKRVLPDILVAVQFLTTRVTKSTQEDMDKLVRILRYVKDLKDPAIYLSAELIALLLRVCADAAFGVHMDGKSQSGLTMSIGQGTILTKSTKQRSVTKSSTEAEMKTANEATTDLIWVRRFLYETWWWVQEQPAVLEQDNSSAIALINNGKSNSDRTKYLAIDQFFVSDRQLNGELVVKKVDTLLMDADFLSKATQGDVFASHVARVTGRAKVV